MPGKGREVGLSGGGALVGHEHALGMGGLVWLTRGVVGSRGPGGLACRSAVVVIWMGLGTRWMVLVCRSPVLVSRSWTCDSG